MTVTGGGGCTISGSITLGEPAVLTLNHVITSATQVTLTAVGGTPAYKYRRCSATGTLCKNSTGGAGYGSGNVFTGLVPGTTYKFQSQDKNKCVAEITVTMPANKPSAGTEILNENDFFENAHDRNLIGNQKVSLAPNPFSEKLLLVRNANVVEVLNLDDVGNATAPQNFSVEIFDLNGRLVVERDWSAGVKFLEIETTRLVAGVFFVKIFDKKNVLVESLRAVKM